MKHSIMLTSLFIWTVFLSGCEESPGGIENALFGGPSQEVELTFSFVNDANNLLDNSKSGNEVPNWGEEIYFDAVVRNNLDEEIQNVRLSIIGVDDLSKVNSWDENPLTFGSIPSSGQAEPSTFWFSETVPYLGRTRIKTSASGFGTSLVNINLRLSFTYNREEIEKDIIHTITIFP